MQRIYALERIRVKVELVVRCDHEAVVCGAEIPGDGPVVV